jgi:hypothetical protein
MGLARTIKSHHITAPQGRCVKLPHRQQELPRTFHIGLPGGFTAHRATTYTTTPMRPRDHPRGPLSFSRTPT